LTFGREYGTNYRSHLAKKPPQKGGEREEGKDGGEERKGRAQRR
jgi:hypothetical protein